MKVLINYKLFQTNTEFVDFQEKENVKIVNIMPYNIGFGADTKEGDSEARLDGKIDVGVFVTFIYMDGLEEIEEI